MLLPLPALVLFFFYRLLPVPRIARVSIDDASSWTVCWKRGYHIGTHDTATPTSTVENEINPPIPPSSSYSVRTSMT